MEEDPKDLIAEADAAYKPFQPFSDWAGLIVDQETWDTHRRAIDDVGGDPEKLRRARNAAKTAAAIDTGAIEHLYEVDRGKTINAAVEAGYYQAAFATEPARTRQLIESQLAVYDDVLDFATTKLDLLAAWVRALHAKLCEAQGTYEAETAAGKQNLPLPLGQYKTTPNHVKQPDGTIFSFAPVLETEAEMERYLSEIRSAAFQAAHPILQAAFAHYAFVRIHPFTDGNGRMARALASIFTYRGGSMPLMILVDQRDGYLPRPSRLGSRQQTAEPRAGVQWEGSRNAETRLSAVLRPVQRSIFAAHAEPAGAKECDGHGGEKVEALQFQCPAAIPGEFAKLGGVNQQHRHDHIDGHH
jgi:hypothetical protein